MHIETHNLVKAFGERRVVNDVSINVEQGTVVGLLGPNAAGKTTTFYMIVGIEKPDSGEVLIDGKLLTEGRLDELQAHAGAQGQSLEDVFLSLIAQPTAIAAQ